MLKEVPARAGTLKRLLKDHSFFHEADDQIFRDVEQQAQVVDAEQDVELLEAGAVSPFSWFLLDGAVRLDGADGARRTVAAGSEEAGYPLANLRPSRYRLVTTAPCRLVRLEQSALGRVHRRPPKPRFLGGSPQGGGSWQSHPFALEVQRLERSDSLNLPGMPGISARISEAMSDPDFEIANLARIVAADPTVAGGLLQVANSAVFRGAVAVDSLEAAIIRLGAEQTRTLVNALAAKALFTARMPWVRRRLAELWRHAVEMGAYCAVLAERTAGLDKSKALLLGLLHEIGAVPVLSLAESFAELEQTPGILDATLVNLVPGLTSRILEQWHLPEAFSEAAQHQENWFRDHDGPADYPDALVIGHLHGLIKAGRYRDLPRLDEIPAFQKLGEGGLTARASLAVLDDAQTELKELRALLS